MTKRIGLKMRFGELKERLKYKCDAKKIGRLKVDEKFTSKICSKCGEVNWNLKGEKIYKCPECKMEMDRDVNGCRNIYIRGKYMFDEKFLK